MGVFKIPLFILFVAVVIAQFLPLYNVLRPFDKIDTSHFTSSCELFGDSMFSNSEDLAIYKWGQIFVSAGNLNPLIGHADIVPNGDLLSSNIENGKIGMLTVGSSASCAQVVELDDFPRNTPFHPHGIYFSNNTSKCIHIPTNLHMQRFYRFDVCFIVLVCHLFFLFFSFFSLLLSSFIALSFSLYFPRQVVCGQSRAGEWRF
jgi:hypothetical protein